MRAAVATSPGQVLATWMLLLAVHAGAAWAVLSSPVGQQALVDERVRVIEALGGTLDDAGYAAMQAAPPYWVYLTSGGRLLLFPALTLAVAVAVHWGVRARDTGFVAALSVAVHASVVLVAQQVVSAPLHLLRESLTSPFNLAALLPFFDEGSLPALLLGTVEVFGLWWIALLAVGCGVLAGRRAREFVIPLTGAYVGIAALVAGLVVLTGGS